MPSGNVRPRSESRPFARSIVEIVHLTPPEQRFRPVSAQHQPLAPLESPTFRSVTSVSSPDPDPSRSSQQQREPIQFHNRTPFQKGMTHNAPTMGSRRPAAPVSANAGNPCRLRRDLFFSNRSRNSTGLTNHLQQYCYKRPEILPAELIEMRNRLIAMPDNKRRSVVLPWGVVALH